MADFDTDACTLPDAEVLQVMFEIRIGGRQTSLPAGLHPTNPPTIVVQVWRCPESPWGPFSLAQGRVGSRSGLRPRGFVQGCVCDNERRALRCARAGASRCSGRGHAAAPLRRGGRRRCGRRRRRARDRAADPDPLGPDDVAYSPTLTLAHTPRGARLVQIDTDVAVDARRAAASACCDVFDAEGFGLHPTVEPYHPVSASIALGTIELHRLRYVCRPDELAFTGTETVEG